MEKIKAALQDTSWLELVGPMLINITIAVAIFIIGSWVVSRLVDVLDKVMAARKVDQALRHFLEAILRTALKFVIALLAIEQLGIDTTSLLALLGAAGLAVGLALKDSLSNFASGVMLIMMKPFAIGDWIDAAGISGSVEKITVFNTIVITGDNREIIIPNSQIYSGAITNYSSKSTRRVDLTIGIGYGDDMKKARDLMQQLANNDERILKDPGVTIAVGELGDSSVNFVVRLWVNTPDYWAVKWDYLENVKSTFDANGVSIPYPQQDIHLHKVD